MKIIAYDLGTGGIKASLHNERGDSLLTTFIAYDTFYPQNKYHEQRPSDWWDGVCRSTRLILEKSGTKANEIEALALSGHSLVAAPIGRNGELLLEQVPIWSDTRAEKEASDFFHEIPYDDWYHCTGNGDPAECYSIMKLMWMKRNQPEIFSKTRYVLGSKDYINYRLTGNFFTDQSYASGTGAFNLRENTYNDSYIEAAQLPKDIFPPILPSHGLVGRVTMQAALETGLSEGTLVACGGVDNSCMALGACGTGDGKIYTSLGSSCWIAVTSKQPIIDDGLHPFIFSHIEEGYYTSGMSIFSGGNSYRWVRDQFYKDIPTDSDAFALMDRMAAQAPAGSNGVLFNPSLGGGSAQEKSPNIRGAYMGLSLSTTRDDLTRATMEGISMNLRLLLDGFSRYLTLDGEMLLCGGGSKSQFWRQLFADIYNKKIIKTNIDQNAASLGAAAIAAKCCGMWTDYSGIQALHEVQSIEIPHEESNKTYEKLLVHFRECSDFLAELGDKMAKPITMG